MPFIDGTSGNDTLIGTVGADQIYGREGNDTLNGKAGVNVIYGGDGSDTIITGKGRDLVFGGDGNDLVNVIGNYSGTYFVGGYGGDTISLDRAASGTFLSLDYDIRSFLSTGDDPFDSIDVTIRNGSISINKTESSGAVFRDNVDGLSNLGSDSLVHLFGTHNDDNIDAASRTTGPMLKFFAEGNDQFDGGSSTYEEITFGPSFRFSASDFEIGYNEITITSSSSGQMSGRIVQTEADFSTSSNSSFTTRFTGVDLIEGSTGGDLVTGSSGKDKFRPGYGNDGFDGAGGIDTVYYDATGIVSTIVDLQRGYGQALFSNDGAFDDFGGLYVGNRFVFEDQWQLDGLSRVENVVGGVSDDILRGKGGANVLDGSGGNDILNGRKGNDTLIGGDGDDRMRGAAGQDHFQFDKQDGADRIFGFENGKDKFVLTDGLAFSDVEVVDRGRHALVTFGETEVLVLNIDHTLLGANDFIIA